jgi:uncharacterized protein with HEPN domain
MAAIPFGVAYLLDIFRSVGVIRGYLAGEAAARLTPETCAEFPGIPFHKIAGMRNRVVHDYGHVDFEIVWETVQTHLPVLFKELGRSLQNGEAPDREPMSSHDERRTAR